MKRTYILLCFIIFFFFPSLALAEIVTFEKEYTYQASDFDSRHSSRTLALEMVKRLLLEELGTYLISETEVKNMRLTKDQVTTYSAGIVSAQVIEEKWDGKAFWLKAKVSADPKDVQKALKQIVDDKYKVKELEETRKKTEELTKENKRLRNELELAKKSGSRNEKAEANDIVPVSDLPVGYKPIDLLKAYENTINGLNAVEWFKKGYEAMSDKQRWEEARVSFTKAIELRPDYTYAYSNRGALNNLLGNKQQAIQDYTNAIELQPDSMAYYGRGVAYKDLGNYQQAIKDITKAIKLWPENALAYYARGDAYDELGNYQQAIKDFTKAIKLWPDYDDAYYSRGKAYVLLGNYQQAIKDFTKYIELDPDEAKAYYIRGLAYSASGNKQQSIKDLKIAARLGSTDAQNFLLELGEQW